jgi:cell division protein FtsW
MKWATTILTFCVAVLVGLGLVMLYSSSMNMEMNKSSVGAGYLVSQSVWLLFGLIGCIVAARVDYRYWKKFAPYFLLGSGFLLLLVFAPKIGIGRKGAHRWIGLPGLPHFQPSEMARLALILFIAAYGDRFQRQMHTFKRGFIIPGFYAAIILGLIFIEPDRGCTILLGSVTAILFILAGVRFRFLVLAALLVGGVLVMSLRHDNMRQNRIQAWMHPDEHKEGAGYQAYEAMIALGSGGVTGLGLGNGRQKLGFVPEHHTDFIFSIIGEELGLIATISVVVLFVAFVICGSFIASRSVDTFGFLLASGITFMIGLQAFINMGVVTSLLPNKGMPLPFISYGGSNLLLLMIAVGFLYSVARFAVEPSYRKVNPFESTPELAE